MVRNKLTESEKVDQAIRTHGIIFSKTPNNKLYCQIYNTTVSVTKKYFTDSHIKTKKHEEGVRNDEEIIDQRFLGDNKDDFFNTITETFLQANIPLHKLRHSAIKNLFAKMLHPIPNTETCRSKLDVLYKARKTEIIRKLSRKKFYLVIDESQKNGKKCLNVIVGLV